MEISDLLTSDSVIANLKVTSKKQALQELAKRIAEIAVQEERAVLEVLLEREKLGTTGVGNGIAIPHGKVEGLDKMYGLFARRPNVRIICPAGARAEHGLFPRRERARDGVAPARGGRRGTDPTANPTARAKSQRQRKINYLEAARKIQRQ